MTDDDNRCELLKNDDFNGRKVGGKKIMRGEQVQRAGEGDREVREGGEGGRGVKKEAGKRERVKSEKKIMERARTVSQVGTEKKGPKVNKSLAVLSQVPDKYEIGPEKFKLGLKKAALMEGSRILKSRRSSGNYSYRATKPGISGASEMLYQLGLEKSSERNRKYEEAKSKREEDLLSGCTFTPSISALARKKSSPE